MQTFRLPVGGGLKADGPWILLLQRLLIFGFGCAGKEDNSGRKGEFRLLHSCGTTTHMHTTLACHFELTLIPLDLTFLLALLIKLNKVKHLTN